MELTELINKITNELNTLLHKNKLALKEYQSIKLSTKNPNLTSILKEQLLEKETFIEELREEILCLGGTLDGDNEFKNQSQLKWINIKNPVFEKNHKVIFDEVVRGNLKAASEYTHILKEDILPISTRLLLENQLIGIKSVIREVKSIDAIKLAS